MQGEVFLELDPKMLQNCVLCYFNFNSFLKKCASCESPKCMKVQYQMAAPMVYLVS